MARSNARRVDPHVTPQKRNAHAPYYQIVAHTADTAVKVVARDFSELVDLATQALAAILAGDQKWVVDSFGETRIATQTPERVVVQWLNEMLFLLASKDLLVLRAVAEPVDQGYRIRYEATKVDWEKTNFETEVKSATYHGLAIQKQADGTLMATIVFDL